MTTAGDVSKYIVEYAYNKNSSVSNLQLQKILYFLWIDFYKEYREYLFKDPFEAWALGPVIRNVYYDFCSFGSMTIDSLKIRCVNIHPEKLRQIIYRVLPASII